MEQGCVFCSNFFSCSLVCECGKTFYAMITTSEPSSLSGPYARDSGMVPIHLLRTSAQEPKKSVPFIHYSFAHDVAQPLLQRGEEEQEQEGAKITSTTNRVKAYSTAASKIVGSPRVGWELVMYFRSGLTWYIVRVATG